MKLPVFRDPDTNKSSVTITAFALGFVVATVKLFLSGNEFGGLRFGEFTGSDFGVVVAALGGIYTLRRHSDNLTKMDNKNEKK